MWRYALEMKDPMLMSQVMHKQNPTNAQVSKADGIQVQHQEQYVWLKQIIENQLH